MFKSLRRWLRKRRVVKLTKDIAKLHLKLIAEYEAEQVKHYE